MRNLFLISGHKSALVELTNEVLVRRAPSEVGIPNSLKVDALGLAFSVLCIDFGRYAQEAKGHEPARMRFDLQIRCFEKIYATDKGEKVDSKTFDRNPIQVVQ
jgi:hypothetical protein